MTRRSSAACASLAIALIACKGKHEPQRDDARTVKEVSPRDAGTDEWRALERFPKVEPSHVVALPARSTVPRFDVGGPAVANGIAVVASSQFGFVAVDYHRGQIVWSKPAGIHVAPPLAQAGTFVLLGECLQPPETGDQLLGCVRVVTPTGGDLSYVPVHGKDVAEFAGEPGAQRLWAIDDHTLLWRRGDRAVAVDELTGTATATPAIDPPLDITYKQRTWQIRHDDDGIIRATRRGKPAWNTERSYTAMLGAVYLPDQGPMVRVSNAGRWGGEPEMNLMDIDATGSMHGQVAVPVPGIGLVGHAIDAVGDVAIAVQLDRSLDHDFIVGYAANALLMWVYPLPRVQRADPVGLAVAPDAVVAFHDGDTLTILPELSAPPTAPGAARVPLENPTP
ncbi:MAG: hypothetical protein ABI467_01855 [Kofleriaceae bacterium]